ncbi:MAG: hypothetical protein U0R19_01185 [Bryobacteraceae bacterium]
MMRILISLAAAMQEPTTAVDPAKAVLVELRRAIQQRLPLRVDSELKRYSDYGDISIQAGPVSSTSIRLELLEDSFLLELDLGRGHKGVHRFQGCELTRYSGGSESRHYSKWKFQEAECFSWPRYCPMDCQVLWDNAAFGGLFSPVVQSSVALQTGKGEWVLGLTTLTPRNIPVYWRYHFDPETHIIHRASRRTQDNGNNPVVSEQTGLWTLKYYPLQGEDLERVRNWQPPKGAKLRRGKASSIEAERLAGR